MVQESYLVDGGFGSWVKEGLRTKENKAGNALTILTEVLFNIILESAPLMSLPTNMLCGTWYLISLGLVIVV